MQDEPPLNVPLAHVAEENLFSMLEECVTFPEHAETWLPVFSERYAQHLVNRPYWAFVYHTLSILCDATQSSLAQRYRTAHDFLHATLVTSPRPIAPHTYENVNDVLSLVLLYNVVAMKACGGEPAVNEATREAVAQRLEQRVRAADDTTLLAYLHLLETFTERESTPS